MNLEGEARGGSVIVIGHVNHGKTALVRTLTGADTDRLPEEKRRGMSMALGFAHREFATADLDFIDAPGHEDFIKAMISGASGAQAALLVVSGTEGLRRQSWEHIRVAESLGVRTGVVAVTKADLLLPAERTARRADLERELSSTVWSSAPLVFCSSRTGEGMDDLCAALNVVADAAADSPGLGGAFLPIDRVFAVPGAGVVVTGTLRGAPIAGGEALQLTSGAAGTVRRIEMHAAPARVAAPGRRVALNLRGVSQADVEPGDVAFTPGAFAPALQIDAQVRLWSQAAGALRHMETIRAMFGTTGAAASVRLLNAGRVEPGGSAYARLQFSQPVVAFAGQRMILRRLSPAETIGSGVVLDPVAPPVARRKADRVAVLAAANEGDIVGAVEALARRDGGCVDLMETARLMRRSAQSILADEAHFKFVRENRIVLRSAWEAARGGYLDRLMEAHRAMPMRLWARSADILAAVGKEAGGELAVAVEHALAADGTIRLREGDVALSGHDPLRAMTADQCADLWRLEAALFDAGLAPPADGDLAAAEKGALLDLLIDLGRAKPLFNHAKRRTLIFHSQAIEAALATLRDVFPPPKEFATGEAREALGTSRLVIVPLLEHFDARRLTFRKGDSRRIAI